MASRIKGAVSSSVASTKKLEALGIPVLDEAGLHALLGAAAASDGDTAP